MKTSWLKLLFSFELLFSPALLPAQEKPSVAQQAAASLQTYDVNREVMLVGTVVAYPATSKTAPAGPRVSLQTTSGLIDIHLGDARLLAENHFTMQPGDTLRIIGENITFSGGTQFVARILQRGTQALLLRSTTGFPIISSAPRRAADLAKQGSVL